MRGEAAAEALDAEIEDDVLALSKSLDLRELVEDELLLDTAHRAAPRRLPAAAAGAAGTKRPAPEDVPERENPFAALQRLKSSTPGGAGG